VNVNEIAGMELGNRVFIKVGGAKNGLECRRKEERGEKDSDG
jgi:hypothetical protein